MGQQWQFTQDDDARWRWTRLDDGAPPLESATSFPDRMRCVMDAMRFAVERRKADADAATDTAQLAGAYATTYGTHAQSEHCCDDAAH